MIGYVTLGVRDLERSQQFYSAVLGFGGIREWHRTDRGVFFGLAQNQPLLAICIPLNGEPASFGNGTMVALQFGSMQQVDSAYQKAIELGGSCEGAPGYRVEGVFYAAYVRDIDGNKLAFTWRKGN